MEQQQRFVSDVQQLAAMRAFAREACRCAWGTECDEAIAALELALGEAAANIILHAYGGQGGLPIEMAVEVDTRQARVSLYHEGKDFDPTSAAPPVFDGSREGGFGLYLIRQAVDEVAFFTDDRGRRGVHLIKRRGLTHPGGGTMLTDVEQVGDVTVVTITVDQLDAANADDFRQALVPVLKDCRQLVLDLGRVEFLDSRGCGAILSCLKQVSANGGDLKLCQVTRHARTVLDLLRFHRLCEITDTRDQAVQAFQQP